MVFAYYALKKTHVMQQFAFSSVFYPVNGIYRIQVPQDWGDQGKSVSFLP